METLARASNETGVCMHTLTNKSSISETIEEKHIVAKEGKQEIRYGHYVGINFDRPPNDRNAPAYAM